MRVVVDTNVLVSGLISPSGAPARIVKTLLAGQVVPVLSEATFTELRTVLQRPRLARQFARAGASVSAFLADFAEVAEFVRPVPTPAAIRDPKDRAFLELAASRPAPDFIITGDRDFEMVRYAGVPVISPTDFARTVLPTLSR